jgi:serine/threonine-protein kinase
VLAADDVIGDRYRLTNRIAAGGMGEVWQATDSVLGRSVAVKVLHAERSEDPEFQARFRHEARAMAALRHPGVADVYDYGETGDDAYIVMSHIDGQPLSERIAEAGRLDPATTMDIVAQTARALSAAHSAGIIHRDVKPGNLITKPDGTVVLVDFGIARSANSTTLTGINDVVGTAQYIAPEQVSKQDTGPATDLYALGTVAYECLAGRPPFLGDNPVTVALRHLNDDPPPLPADVPSPVRELVGTAMAKRPADRFSSATAMAEAADAVTNKLGTAGYRDRPVVAPVPGTAGSGRRSRIALIAGGLALVAVAAIAIVLFTAGSGVFIPGSPPPASPTNAPAGSAGAGNANTRTGTGTTAPSRAPGSAGGGNPRGGGGPATGPNPTQPAPTGPAPEPSGNPQNGNSSAP